MGQTDMVNCPYDPQLLLCARKDKEATGVTWESNINGDGDKVGNLNQDLKCEKNLG